MESRPGRMVLSSADVATIMGLPSSESPNVDMTLIWDGGVVACHPEREPIILRFNAETGNWTSFALLATASPNLEVSIGLAQG